MGVKREHWWQFPRMDGGAIGWRRGPWAMTYPTSGTGVRLELCPTSGVVLSGAIRGRGLIVGWMPVGGWPRLGRLRALEVGTNR